MRITRLKLQNWRNFQQVEFQLERRAFFVGPNASGKSNLLDALRFLRDLVSVGGGLQEAVRERRGIGEMRSFSARRNPNILIEIDLGDDDRPAMWTYSLELKIHDRSRMPMVEREEVRQYGQAAPLLMRPESEDKTDPARLSQTAIEQINSNKKFRPVADFLASIRYLHVVPQIVREPNRSSGSNDPFGGDLIERINATNAKTRDARLRRMEEALRIAVPQLSKLELEIDEKGVPHLRANYKHWRPQGAWQRESSFSDGTLRLLGLIWSLQEAGGPLLLEEPEMSLNGGVISKLAPLISRATRRSKRQVLITTHSADLLADGVAVDEVQLLSPSDQGTLVTSGADLEDVRTLVHAGVPLGEALLPKAKAREVDRLPLLDLMTS